MKISEVIALQNATIENVEVISKEEIRQFEKFGKVTKVCNAKLKDDSGEIQMTLWNEEIDQVQEGDKISIIDGWVKEWQGNLQISKGRNGQIVKAGEEAAASAEEPAAEEAEAAPEESTEEVKEE